MSERWSVQINRNGHNGSEGWRHHRTCASEGEAIERMERVQSMYERTEWHTGREPILPYLYRVIRDEPFTGSAF